MAQTGYSTIQIYASGTASNVPTTGNLTNSSLGAEIAINYADGKLYYKDSGGTVQVLATKDATSGSFTNLAYTGTLTGGTGVVNLGSGQFYKDASGLVGIGTSTGGGKLQVSVGTTNISGSAWNSSNFVVGGSSSTSGGFGVSYNDTTGTIIASLLPSTAWKDLTIYSNQAIFCTGGVNERMRIDSSGNVGIGASSSGSYRLYLSGSNATTAVGVVYNDTGTSGRTYAMRSDAGSFITTDVTASAERMRIDSSGNLLVGTTTSNGKISVTGSSGVAPSYFRVFSNGDAGTFYANASGTVVGSVTVNSGSVLYNVTSDYRLKSAIAPVVNAGTRIDAIKPVEYDFKDGGRIRGFLAHEFAEVYPDSVTGKKDAVDEEGKPVYQAMQASTPEVIADLIAEIQSLRKRVAILEAKG